MVDLAFKIKDERTRRTGYRLRYIAQKNPALQEEWGAIAIFIQIRRSEFLAAGKSLFLAAEYSLLKQEDVIFAVDSVFRHG